MEKIIDVSPALFCFGSSDGESVPLPERIRGTWSVNVYQKITIGDPAVTLKMESICKTTFHVDDDSRIDETPQNGTFECTIRFYGPGSKNDPVGTYTVQGEVVWFVRSPGEHDTGKVRLIETVTAIDIRKGENSFNDPRYAPLVPSLEEMIRRMYMNPRESRLLMERDHPGP